MFCVYLTTYSGNKLPPFYIGSTSVEKISKGYRGSVASIAYRKIWKSEIANNTNKFKTRIIKTFQTREEASLYEEKLHIKLMVTQNTLYVNMARAGKNFYQNCRHSDETKNKISKANKGNPKPPRSPAHCQKLSECTKGRVTSPETKQKLSEKFKGRVFSEEWKQKLSLAAKNRVYTDEDRIRMSICGRGIKKSEVGRKNIANGNKGKNKGKIGIWMIATGKQKKIYKEDIGQYDGLYVLRKNDLPEIL